ncbi:hypothetical protein NET03_02810 [Thermomicrobium sp. CFH 73360]|uniref:hypothetical protein n=1 Tax=Thermomicrobium sp. CFH 73360 TaxID=2951987 RepID=UPI0020769B8D|nr:hypothetical protein [Thermomicrobium sp. CFH 73360]MCM8745456.1 hypothetical protein [Thermomicrobium sp. CFH 73360]
MLDRSTEFSEQARRRRQRKFVSRDSDAHPDPHTEIVQCLAPHATLPENAVRDGTIAEWRARNSIRPGFDRISKGLKPGL